MVVLEPVLPNATRTASTDGCLPCARSASRAFCTSLLYNPARAMTASSDNFVMYYIPRNYMLFQLQKCSSCGCKLKRDNSGLSRVSCLRPAPRGVIQYETGMCRHVLAHGKRCISGCQNHGRQRADEKQKRSRARRLSS